jgi:hypothetical protein
LLAGQEHGRTIPLADVFESQKLPFLRELAYALRVGS